MLKGQLGFFSTFLQVLVWGLFFSFPYLYNPADWAWSWLHEIGVFNALALTCVAGGLVILALSMTGLGMDRSFGVEAGGLKQTGLYRFTSNPLIVGSAPIIVGLALLWPSWFALAWVVLFAAMAHMMVLTEEEHLRKLNGREYEQYCKRVPRYLGFPSTS